MVGALMSDGAAALTERTNWRRAQTIFSTELSLLRRWILSGDRRDGDTADRDALITALKATPMSDSGLVYFSGHGAHEGSPR
jgi:hypothetical protein